MHPDRLFASLLAVAFPILTIWMLRKASDERETGHAPNRKVLRFTKSWRVWLCACMILFVLGFSSDLFFGKVKAEDRMSFWVTFVGFGVVIGAFSWFLRSYRVEYDEQDLSVYWPGGYSRTTSWSAVTSAEFKKGTGIVLTMTSGKRQVIPSILPGAEEFLNAARARANRAA